MCERSSKVWIPNKAEALVPCFILGCNTIVGVQPSSHTSFYTYMVVFVYIVLYMVFVYMVVFGNEVHSGSSVRLLTSMPMMLMQRWKGFFEKKNNNGSSVKLVMSMQR